MNKLDLFYPISETMSSGGIWEIGMVVKLAGHRQMAKSGDLERESRLVNRLGQLRRNCEYMDMSNNLKEEINESVAYLRSVGRKVDFSKKNPAEWITTRKGNPRW